jgi:nucleoside-diphosphate-sugar epimerase
VVNWIAFEPTHIEADLQRFSGKVGQYIFISSASAYQKPPASLPIRESTPLHNPVWGYSQGKIACEERLMRAYRETGFPATIVRPSHTYDRTYLPIHGGWTNIERLRVGKPIVIHGDGTSLWTMTHHRDFGRAFAGLVGNPHALGEAFHITSDESLSWNQIYAYLADAFGAPLRAVHIASERIAALDPSWGDSLLGDKAHSVLFDNSKIKGLVPGWRAEIPFWQGAQEIAAHYAAHHELQVGDEAFDRTLERLLAAEAELRGELARRK